MREVCVSFPFLRNGFNPILRVFLGQEPADESIGVAVCGMGFAGSEDFKLRFVEATRLNPILGFHSRFRWFSLRRPCGAFILHGIKEERRFIFIYFQGRRKNMGFCWGKRVKNF